MNMKKIVATASALSLTAAIAVGGTLAWLQDDSNTITNTFTWDPENNITLTLDETKFVNGEPTGERWQQGNEYTVIPGATVQKDPQLDLTTKTSCYIYVAIDNQFGNDVTLNNLTTTNGWTEMTGVKVGNAQVYYKADALNGTTNDIKVFDSITFSPDWTDADADDIVTNKIIVTGYAVQASAAGEDGDAIDAWEATFGKTATTEP